MNYINLYIFYLSMFKYLDSCLHLHLDEIFGDCCYSFLPNVLLGYHTEFCWKD